MPVNQAARRLRSLLAGGWLVRPRQGLYLPVPLDAISARRWQDDPWLMAAKLFPDGYIGGWSACEYWELTDQVFRDILVFSPRRARSTSLELGVGSIQIRHLGPTRAFGVTGAWRAGMSVPVSDAARTIVDILDNPSNGGGIRHVAEAVDAWVASGHRDDRQLGAYAKRFGNRAVFKRLGYLLEALEIDAPRLRDLCVANLSQGINDLDPSLPSDGPIRSRWRLRINADIRR